MPVFTLKMRAALLQLTGPVDFRLIGIIAYCGHGFDRHASASMCASCSPCGFVSDIVAHVKRTLTIGYVCAFIGGTLYMPLAVIEH